jgi:hypothetical protein
LKWDKKISKESGKGENHGLEFGGLNSISYVEPGEEETFPCVPMKKSTDLSLKRPERRWKIQNLR